MTDDLKMCMHGSSFVSIISEFSHMFGQALAQWRAFSLAVDRSSRLHLFSRSGHLSRCCMVCSDAWCRWLPYIIIKIMQMNEMMQYSKMKISFGELRYYFLRTRWASILEGVFSFSALVIMRMHSCSGTYRKTVLWCTASSLRTPAFNRAQWASERTLYAVKLGHGDYVIRSIADQWINLISYIG